MNAHPRNIQRFHVDPRLEPDYWHSLRKTDVTASAAAALLGAHPYASAFSLWTEKTGALPAKASTPSMERGLDLEIVATRRLARDHADWNFMVPSAYYRDVDHRIGATPDLLAIRPEGLFDPTTGEAIAAGQCAIQIKSVEPSAFKRNWLDDDGAISPPPYAAIQAIIEADLTGSASAMVAALVVSHGVQLFEVEVPLVDGVLDAVRQKADEFWKIIESGGQPPNDFGIDTPILAALYPHDSGSIIDLSSDEALLDLVLERERIGKEKGVIDKRQDAIKGEILSRLRDAAGARLADGSILSAKTVNRDGYTVKPTSFRDIRWRKKP